MNISIEDTVFVWSCTYEAKKGPPFTLRYLCWCACFQHFHFLIISGKVYWKYHSPSARLVYFPRFLLKHRKTVTVFEIQKAELLVLQSAQCESFQELFHKLDDNSWKILKQDSPKQSLFIGSESTDSFNKTTVSHDELGHLCLLWVERPALVLMLWQIQEYKHHGQQIPSEVWLNGDSNLLGWKFNCAASKQQLLLARHWQLKLSVYLGMIY